MNEINIKDLKINFEISQILDFINQKKEFEIDVLGNIAPSNTLEKTSALIFRGTIQNEHNLLDLPQLIANGFGRNYKPVVDANSCTLTPLGAWQDIIALNQGRMSYFDHQTDGVEVFEDKALEDIGWNAIPLDITYREITEHIEQSCEGTFLFYDNGMNFNGFVILNDLNDVEQKMTQFIKEVLNNKIENEQLDLDDEEVEESIAFFNSKG